MESDVRGELVREIGVQSAAWQEDVHRFDAAAARLLGVNGTDLRCAFLLLRGPMTAKELSQATGLTPGAVTTVIDRLEEAELAKRRPDGDDRRRISVDLTPDSRRRVAGIFGPLAAEGAAMLRRYSTAELRRLRDFIVELRDLQAQHTLRVESRKR